MTQGTVLGIPQDKVHPSTPRKTLQTSQICESVQLCPKKSGAVHRVGKLGEYKLKIFSPTLESGCSVDSERCFSDKHTHTQPPHTLSSKVRVVVQLMYSACV